ncbi:MAG: hypothetical protein ACXWV2_09980, partial [Chitinophagaceae bacterium]
NNIVEILLTGFTKNLIVKVASLTMPGNLCYFTLHKYICGQFIYIILCVIFLPKSPNLRYNAAL